MPGIESDLSLQLLLLADVGQRARHAQRLALAGVVHRPRGHAARQQRALGPALLEVQDVVELLAAPGQMLSQRAEK